ncbi:heat stress transcription factor B-1-like [Phoenix dactylifera]|uniref:Heat stress transcription factor B-1-like n=1 Tax=Phoenix dactylifera TaxID=42345 RepID=A0A8B7CWV2_PHODC|nr:heat stress transcription factor B-1-like [Phoenix dactylifera]
MAAPKNGQQNNSSSSSNNGGKDRSPGGPAPFLTKTHEMVEDRRTDEVISWGENGRSFVVWRPVEFARDLLPVQFKHNNFSSFVRQLNTYGFRKVVPDRWEFANENFRQGERRLLCEIRRRKAAPPQPPLAGKTNAGLGHHPCLASSTSNSGEVHSSSSTSSTPPPPTLPPQQLLDLINENEKIKKDNKILRRELAKSRQHCRDLFGFLSKFIHVDELDISLLMREKGLTEARICRDETTKKKDVEEEVGKKEEGLKLFGVLLKGFEGKERKKSRREKRGRCDGVGEGYGAAERPMKMGFVAPWMGLSTPVRQGSSKVCD